VTSGGSDWRLQGQETYLAGAVLVRRVYGRYEQNPEWDHDHCEFCWAKFSTVAGDGVHTRGYCTPDEYRWVCERCFEDFREAFRWSVVPEGRQRRARDIMQAINAVLENDWDPIGVGASAESPGEYNAYVGRVYRLLASRPAAAQVAALLRSIETDELGLHSASTERRQNAAVRLLAVDIEVGAA
jgi:hypothetical protein